VNALDPLQTELHARADALIASGRELCIAPQCVFEFWAVATKPAPPDGNGLGLTIDDALRAIEQMLANFLVIPDPPDLISRWPYLCYRYQITGRLAHDARLAAWLLGNGISQLWTLDAGFSRFEEVLRLDNDSGA
jgi:predicted nucleic acid-binding protein